jgi:hydroxyethylthiazole kinase-like uncharacterized protein yjeF
MKILNADQLRQADQITIKNEEIESIDLMERAAIVCYNWLVDQNIEDKKIHIFCGLGNNGGDGLAIARYLYEDDFMIETYIVHFSDNMSNDFVTNYQFAEEIGIRPASIHQADDLPKINKDDIVIDAIFGIGLNKPVKGIVKEQIDYINKSGAKVYAVDVPSGLFIDKINKTSQSIIQADMTLTFQTPKLAFMLPDNEKYVKDFVVLDIGLDQDFINSIKTNYQFNTIEVIRKFYRKRSRFAHKGNFGHALIMGGSYGKIGASLLAAKAALKVGSGLVTAYIPKCGYQILQTAVPEVMVEVDADDQLEYFNYKVNATHIGIGIGMGVSDKTVKGFKAFLEKNKFPLVIDADALNILANHKELLTLLPKDTILTPHPKELERLIGSWKDDYSKLSMLKSFSIKYQCIIVVKGAYTLLVDKNKYYFNSSANPALATAGTGDVLTGIITGLLAQNYTAIEAAMMGVFLHASTADIAKSFGNSETFIASDIINILPEAFYSISTTNKLNHISDELFDDLRDDYYFDDDDFPV